MPMTKAIYAFSGDPIHYGHLDIIQRAAAVFDEVIVAIGVNPDKKYLFSLEERLAMAKRAIMAISPAHASSFQGLLVDYAYEQGANVIVKGVRDGKDFEYERHLHQVGESQKLGIDTFLLPAKRETAHISSSIVKALQQEQGLIHEYVPLHVKQCLEATLTGQYIVGVTGEIGSGKSYICERFVEEGRKEGLSVHHIELDHIGHEILATLPEPSYQKVREEIGKTFGPAVQNSDGTINRKVLGELVFGDADKLKELNKIMYTPLLTRLRRELYGKKGIILINAALLAESQLTYLCNNNVLFVKIDKETQRARLEGRGLSPEQIQHRLNSQYTFGGKYDELLLQIASHHQQGQAWILDNSKNAAPEQIRKSFLKIAHHPFGALG